MFKKVSFEDKLMRKLDKLNWHKLVLTPYRRSLYNGGSFMAMSGMQAEYGIHYIVHYTGWFGRKRKMTIVGKTGVYEAFFSSWRDIEVATLKLLAKHIGTVSVAYPCKTVQVLNNDGEMIPLSV